VISRSRGNQNSGKIDYWS